MVALNGDVGIGINFLTFSVEQGMLTSCSDSVGEGSSWTGNGGKAGLGFGFGGNFDEMGISAAQGKSERISPPWDQ